MQAEGYPHPWNEVERAERSGGLHKRSAEDWGSPLRRAIGAEPLSEACFPCARASARMNFQGRALRGRTQAPHGW